MRQHQHPLILAPPWQSIKLNLVSDPLCPVSINSAMGSFKMDKKVQQKMQHETKTLQGKKLVPDNTAKTQKYDERYYHQP